MMKKASRVGRKVAKRAAPKRAAVKRAKSSRLSMRSKAMKTARRARRSMGGVPNPGRLSR